MDLDKNLLRDAALDPFERDIYVVAAWPRPGLGGDGIEIGEAELALARSPDDLVSKARTGGSLLDIAVGIDAGRVCPCDKRLIEYALVAEFHPAVRHGAIGSAQLGKRLMRRQQRQQCETGDRGNTGLDHHSLPSRTGLSLAKTG